MVTQLPTWFRFLLTLALLLPTILPALAPATSALSLTSASTSASPFTSPLPPPTPAPLPATRLALTLDVDPAWAEPGDVVTFTVTATNVGATPLVGLTLTDALPDGLRYVAGSAVGFAYTASQKQLTWQPAAMTAGAPITGSFQARVQELALGDTVTNTVTANASGLAAPRHAHATVDVVSPRSNEAWVTPEHGGRLRAPDDRILLRVPPGAVRGRTRFTYVPETDVPNPPPGLRFAFRLEAADERGQVVRQFPAALELTIVAPPDRNGLHLYYYEETTQRWIAVPTQRRPHRAQWQARLDHLTLFAGVSATCSDNICPEVMPSLRGAHSDLFSGAATIAQPIPLPPGAGGFTPQLTLQFNSRSRQDDAGHASVLGTGWKLSADSFIYWTPYLMGTPGRVWRIEGVSYTESGGTLLEAPDWRIQFSGTGADAYAPDGRRYHFERALSDWVEGSGYWRTDKWVLQWVTSPVGNRIEYIYDTLLPVDPNDVNVNYADYTDALGKRYRKFVTGSGVYRYLSQINLKQIRYNFDAGGVPQTIIELEHLPRYDAPDPMCQPDDEDDPNLQNENWDYWYAFTTRLLSAIRVRQQDQIVTDYKLDYDVWGWGCAHTLRYALKRVTACSDAALTNCLPPTEFINQPQNSNDNGKVVQMDNGYGGHVAYVYTSAYAWAVTAKTVSDATTGQSAAWTYSYAAVAQSAGVTVGFTAVTETLPASLGTGNTVYHHFLSGNDTDRAMERGKEDLRRTIVNGIAQEEVARAWDSTLGGNMALLTQEERRQYDASGGSYQAQQTRYYYDLDAAHNGPTQYGNPTRIAEYSDAGMTLYRTTERWYKPREDLGSGVYQAHLPAQEKLWQGPVGSSCQSQTRYIYDTTGLSNWTVPPTWGQLREVWRAQVCDSAHPSDWVRQAAYAYADGHGNRTHETQPNGDMTITSYDTTRYAYPLTVTVQPGSGGGPTLTTTYRYYDLNAEPGGSGLFGQLQSVTDPNAAVMRYRYDAWGRLIEVRRPVVDPAGYTPPCSGFACAATEVYAYMDAPAPFTIYHASRKDAQPDSVSTASYRQDWTFYDGLGQVIQTQAEGATPAQGVLVSTRYNALGRVISQTVPYFGTANGVYQPLSAWAGKTTSTLYDALGRVTKVLAPDNTWVDTVYNGRQTAVVDALRHQTIRETDAFGRLVSVKQYTNVATPPNWNAPVAFQATYEYNVRDQLEKVTGSDGAISDPSYDLLGRKTSLTDADMGAWQYRYDAAGNLVKQRDARHQAICFYYDGHHWLIGKTYHAGVNNLDTLTCSGAYTISYGYDADVNGLGRRTSMADGSGSTNWSYDARGRVTNESKTIGAHTFATGHSYRADDAPATLTYPDGEVLTYGYDAAGQLTTLSGALASWSGTVSAAYLSAASYNALGQPLSRVYSNTFTLGYGYHPTSYRLASLTAPGISLSYGYGANGNIKTITDTNQVTTFIYDDLDRLKTASGGYSASYSYQPNGNLTTKTEGGVTINLSYPAGSQPRPHTPVSVNGQTYTYNANGNLETRPGQSFSYDAENRLTQVVSGTVTTTFTYDGDGNLVKQVTPAGTTLYVGAHYEVQPLPAGPLPLPPPPLPPTLTKRSFLPFVANTALFVDGQPAQPVKYYLVGGQRIASRTGSAGPVTYYYHDQLGSTVGSSGGESTRYFPFGATRSGSLGTAYQFTGQRREPALGLYFYQARWYDPLLGRFVQPDPLVPQPGNPQAFNRYAYTLNNPLKYTDPSGHWIESALDIAFIGYDIYDIKTNGLTWTSGLSLAADVAGLVLPVVTGGGLLVRGLAHADDVAKAVAHVDDVAKAASHADEAAKVVKATAKEAPIVIGEKMTRVQSYADKIGGKTINDFIPSERWSMEVNETWVKQMRAEGREIVDIGPDFRRRADRVERGIRPDAAAYNLERKELKGYEGYRKIFERTGKYRGGVPGIDWE